MTPTTKEAPGAASTAAEGQILTNTKEGEESVMNTVAPATDTPSTMTPEQLDFASRCADYDILVKVSGRKKCGPEKLDDGLQRFTAGCILISPRQKRITVVIADGAYLENLRMLQGTAEDFRAGREWSKAFDGLETRHYGDSEEQWYCTEWLGFTAESFIDPDGHMRVTPCHEERCTGTWHEYDSVTALGTPDVLHFGEQIKHPGGRYSVGISRMTGADWKVDVDVSEYDLSVRDARSLCNDIQWLATECAKLNATEAVDA